jgi:hypothetical protein
MVAVRNMLIGWCSWAVLKMGNGLSHGSIHGISLMKHCGRDHVCIPVILHHQRTFMILHNAFFFRYRHLAREAADLVKSVAYSMNLLLQISLN